LIASPHAFISGARGEPPAHRFPASWARIVIARCPAAVDGGGGGRQGGLAMRRVVGWLLATLAVIGTSSCAHQRSQVVDCKEFIMEPSQYGQQFQGEPGQEAQAELNFICQVSVYGYAQMSYARLAEERAASPAVKDFAAKVLDAQSEMNNRIRQIAIQQEGVTAPRGLDAARLDQREQLAGLSGGAFDRAYLQMTVQDGLGVLRVFHREASTAEPVMGRFAGNGQPVIEERVRQAQSLLGQTGY
jgi:predicted outer membrane protein